MKPARAINGLAAVGALACAAASSAWTQPASWIDAQAARKAFDELEAACSRDAGRLWGASLCGPIMFVDPASRALLANVRPGEIEGASRAGFFATTLPASELIANTSIKWAGLHWAQVIWPLPKDYDSLVLLLHESFHRFQAEQKWTSRDRRGANTHLDTLEGRYLLQLEWRALAQALDSQGAARRRAVQDALSFRLARRKRFPKASTEEIELERHEGLAEYTAVRLAAQDAERQRTLAKVDLQRAPEQESFVRSFAYASGPAYGLLLDESGTSWRGKAKDGADLSGLLAASLGLSMKAAKPVEVEARAKAYDDGSLRAAEEARDQAARRRLAGLTKKLLDDPVLELPINKPNIQFNPNNLIPLGESGTVYPTARLVDDWGILSVTNDMLFDDRRRRAFVAAPAAPAGKPLQEGWTLELNPGWSIAQGNRSGDFSVKRRP